jgi:hypothetical protein
MAVFIAARGGELVMTEQTFETASPVSPTVSDTATVTLNGSSRSIGSSATFGSKPSSTADLVKLASEQVSQLVRDEIALAKLEMTAKAKKMGVGAGLFGGAGVVVFYGVGALLAGLALLLALVLPAWAAALIVAGGLFLVAGILALIGRGEFQRAGTPVPEQAIEGVRADVDTVSQAVKDGRQ